MDMVFDCRQQNTRALRPVVNAALKFGGQSEAYFSYAHCTKKENWRGNVGKNCISSVVGEYI
jgi:hypothetical protein